MGGAPANVLEDAGAPGRYQLIRRLATGGMAELFLAHARAMHGFEKLVVLKRILPQHADSEDFIKMFLTEARLAAALHHPNIVQVYDIGHEQDAYFFTMEYVQGEDLRKLVRRAHKVGRAIPLEHIMHIVSGIAAGLHHAHTKAGLDGRPLGIVHRDVSPSNVLVTYEGDVKIVDFGIAKASTAQVSTVAGTLKGKIPYMSPEQCRGETVDRRSDIFSIGTLLWELTTGRRLFSGDNEFAILNRVAKGEVPAPSTVRADYPPELEAIVMKALQADRDNRYDTALELQLDLEDFGREARLPVSSARMGMFMRDLFESEARKSDAQLHADRTMISIQTLQLENPSGDEGEATDSTAMEVSLGSLQLPDAGVGDEIVDTDVRGTGPRRFSRTGLIGLGASLFGFVAMVGIMRSEPASDVGTAPAPAQPAAAVGAASPAPDDEAIIIIEPEQPPTPLQPELVVSSPVRSRSLEDQEPIGGLPATPETVADEPEDKPRAKKTSSKRAASSRARKRKARAAARRRAAAAPKPASTKRPGKAKWDPDAALPPGL